MLDSLSALRAIDANIQIVIADQSKHHSAQIMAQLREHCKNNVTHLRLSKPSIVAAMNVGLLENKASHILFLDDDIKPDPNLITEHRKCIAKYTTALIAGRVIQPWDNNQGIVNNSQENFSFNGLNECKSDLFMGGNFIVNRELALSLGGFDENFIATAHDYEREFSERILNSGYEIIYNGAAAIHHLKAPNGGIRNYGKFLRTIKPHQAVSAYYYIFQSKSLLNKPLAVLRRLRQRLINRTQLRQPWWIPITLISELGGLAWALGLIWNGPKLIAR